MNKKLFYLISVIIAISMIITACGGPNVAPWDGSVKRAEATAWQINQDQTATAVIAAAQGAIVSTPGAPGAPPVASTPESVDARGQRLLSADANYRSQGAAAWARQLNFSFGSISQDARQPEEETFVESNGDNMTVVSGLQVSVTNLKASSPACFTTDQKVAGRSRFVKPDNFDPIKNPSVLYTDNEVGYSGPATLWGDCSNWANLMSAPVAEFTTTSAPAYSAPAATSAPAPAVQTNLTLADLAKLGTVIQRLEYPAGTLAGAQIEFTTDWTPPAGWTIQMNGTSVSSVKSGDIASVWSPDAIRPLAEN